MPLAAALFLVLVAACSGSPSFRGTELNADPAPPFELVDQFGVPTALEDFSGNVVVLSFLYTNCPDVCPLVTETLRRTHVLLGNDAEKVEFLAVSVDPERDTVSRVHRYSEDRGMLDRWRFLVGNEEQLRPIWKAYWLDPIQGEAGHEGDGGPAEIGAEPDDSNPGTYLVTHTAPVFLIDREGMRRALFTNLSLDVEPLLADIRNLLE